MPVNRFYLNSVLLNGSTVRLEEAEHHHLAHVIRVVAGENVELVNGQGTLAQGTIIAIEKKSTTVRINASTHHNPLAPQITLAIPLMRTSKLEWIVEKGTELGVNAFHFYKAMHSEIKELSTGKLERLRTLAIAALKQSGRLYLPSCELLPQLTTLFVQEALFLFGDIRSDRNIDLLSLKMKPKSPIVFITGPEQGFTTEELKLLDSKAIGVRLSAHILRAETAPIAAASILGILTID